MWRFNNRPRKNATVAIVVPHHRFPLTPDEQVSLRHLRHYLSAYDTYWVGPPGLAFEDPEFRVQTFAPSYFASHAGYNRLLMSREFYEAFAHYEYMLLYQLDCLVFSADVEAWCRKGWDYVGAPWIEEGTADTEDAFLTVGNGGLSLRHVQRHLQVLNSKVLWRDPLEFSWQTPCRMASPLLQRIERRLRRGLYVRGYGNDVRARAEEWLAGQRYEDRFWAFEAISFCPVYRIPTAREALPFSFEVAPRFCYRENGSRLPFGCHAWVKIDRAFWEPYLLPGEDGAAGMTSPYPRPKDR